jgi:hypothetical protein
MMPEKAPKGKGKETELGAPSWRFALYLKFKRKKRQETHKKGMAHLF